MRFAGFDLVSIMKSQHNGHKCLARRRQLPDDWLDGPEVGPPIRKSGKVEVPVANWQLY